jgi:hypothetical protein
MIHHEDAKNGNGTKGNGDAFAVTILSVLSVLVVNAVAVRPEAA